MAAPNPPEVAVKLAPVESTAPASRSTTAAAVPALQLTVVPMTTVDSGTP
jgi:hypothetical protein